jgi:hypothetical protein
MQRFFCFVVMPQAASGLSRQDTLPAEDPSWSYSPVSGLGQPSPIPPRNEPLLFIPNHTTHDNINASRLKNLSKVHLLPGAQQSLRFVDMPLASGFSRQDTLPAEDPSWSYSPVPGQPAPIPPRNEPLLFIPNHTAHDNASCLTISEGNPRIETSSTDIINPGHQSDNAVLNFYHVCSRLICFRILIMFHYIQGAQLLDS